MEIPPEIPADIASSIHDEIIAANNILIISHRSPDADTVGSNLALNLLAKKHGKNVTPACIDSPISKNGYLPGAESFIKDFNPADFDLFICVDCGSVSQTAFPEKIAQILETETSLINIDHHPSNNNYGTINLVMNDAASTTLILFKLFKAWKEPITPEAATCLLAGLYFDTGSFMHSNTDSAVYEAAGKLLELGAKKDPIINNLFKKQTMEKLHLLGKILTNTRLTDKLVAFSAVKQEDMASCGGDHHDVSGAIDMLNSVKGNRFAALLSEDDEGNVRGSLRTKNDDVNMSEIAGTLGGGGHKKASGFSVKGKLKKEIRWVIKAE